MSTVVKPEYKIRCGRCQQQMRPIWTMQAIRCPCCDHIIRMTRTAINPDGSRTSTAVGNDGAGSRQCQKMESFYNKLREKISGSSNYSYSAPSSLGLLQDVPSGSIRLSESSPRKRAVLCGVTYRKRKYKLKGTINDVKNMKQLLIVSFGFLEQNILVLTGAYFPTSVLLSLEVHFAQFSVFHFLEKQWIKRNVWTYVVFGCFQLSS